MGFALRQKSHSAGGREIVRTTRVEGDALAIGRDPGADVRLSDLAAGLHHLALTRTSAARIELAAAPGLLFELDGRAVARAGFEIVAGADIRIASHLLRVMPGTPPGADVAIEIERIGEAAKGRGGSAGDSLFSLAGLMPGKRTAAWIGVLIVLGIFLAWPIRSFGDRDRVARPADAAARLAAGGGFHPDRMWSSGSLSQVHAGLQRDCKACHVRPFEAVRDQACIQCHTGIGDHADPRQLARARPDADRFGRVQIAFQDAFNIPQGRCVECHTEHEGPVRMPATAQRFCSDCHQRLTARLPDAKVPDAGDFGRAHPQFRPALLTHWNGDRPVLRRVSLDARPREASNLKFPHDLHLSRTNGVAQMARRIGADHGFGSSLACKDCHQPDPSGTRFRPIDMEGDCAMCHSLAFDVSGGTLRTLRHGEPAQVVADLRDMFRARAPSPPATLGGMTRRRPGDVAAATGARRFEVASAAPGRAERAIRAVFSPGGACYDCHQVEAPARGLGYRIRPVAFPVRYMHNGWFDHRAHATQTCASCHAAPRSSSAADLLLPDIASCRTCHGGEASARPVASGCAMCHDYHMDEAAPRSLIRRDAGARRVAALAAGR